MYVPYTEREEAEMLSLSTFVYENRHHHIT